MSPNKSTLRKTHRCSVVPLYPNVLPESVAESLAHTPSHITPIPGYIPSYTRQPYPRTQVIVQISRNKEACQPQNPNCNSGFCKMFIGRVYDNQKSNKQSTNTITYKEHSLQKRDQSKCRSSDEESDEESWSAKHGKNSANIKKSKRAANGSPMETDKESEADEPVREPRREVGEKTFIEKINEKVKKLKRDKDHKDSKANGLSGDSAQVVYSIPSRDYEKTYKKGKTEKKCSKDKFDSIELDSGDEKRYLEDEGGLKDVSVQATPYPPFRLRVLPHPDWKESETLWLKALRLVVCQCGLACVVLTWALLGALVFHMTEAPREYYQVQEMARRQTELVVGLATDLRQVVPEEPVWRNTIEEYAAHHETLILSAVSSGYPQRGTIWTYCGCLLFATSLLTTLGFGAPVPRTVVGRVSALVFAGLGVPMHLLLVLNVGLLFAVRLHHLARIVQRRITRLRSRLSREKSQEDWPEDIFSPDDTPPPPPRWICLFPFVAIPIYYITGFLLFGVLRGKTFPEVMLFPMDFTAAGGVASTYGPLRVAYAIYLEGAVILASTNVALLRVSATRGFTTLGINCDSKQIYERQMKEHSERNKERAVCTTLGAGATKMLYHNSETNIVLKLELSNEKKQDGAHSIQSLSESDNSLLLPSHQVLHN